MPPYLALSLSERERHAAVLLNLDESLSSIRVLTRVRTRGLERLLWSYRLPAFCLHRLTHCARSATYGTFGIRSPCGNFQLYDTNQALIQNDSALQVGSVFFFFYFFSTWQQYFYLRETSSAGRAGP